MFHGDLTPIHVVNPIVNHSQITILMMVEAIPSHGSCLWQPGSPTLWHAIAISSINKYDSHNENS
jgi:hypothetical protein